MRHSNNDRGTTKKSDPISMLTGDIAAIKRDVAQLIGHGAGNVSARARQAVSDLSDHAKDVAQQTRERYDEAHESLSQIAASRPVTTIAVSLLAGMVMGKALSWAFRRGGHD